MQLDGESSADVGAPEQRNEPPEPPKSALTAALLNLTGFGLGYGYLRRPWLAAASVMATVLLLAGAFVSDAASAPWMWRGIALGWLGLVGMHAAWLARRHPRPTGTRTRLLSVATGVCAVAVVAAGYAGYGAAGHATYSGGVAAQDRGDCATAAGRFDTVTGVYELTLSGDVLAAGARRAECAAFLHAADAQRQGDHAAAVERYRAFDRRFPGSTLTRYVHTNLADAYVEDARSQTNPFTMPAASEAVDTLLMVRREFDDTPAAARALDAIENAFTVATGLYARGKFCEALPALTYFAGLHPTSAGTIVDTANANRANALLRCGFEQLRSGDAGPAATSLGTFVHTYPRHRAIAQARSALITARVAEAANVKLPMPPPLGGNTPGPVPITIYNDSSLEMRMLLAGPTAHEISLPPCRRCPADYPVGSDAACASLNGLPSITLKLKPGKYHYTTVDPAGDPLTESITLEPAFEYDHCMYNERV